MPRSEQKPKLRSLISSARVILQSQLPTTEAFAFGSVLRNLEGKPGLEKWKAAVRVSGIPELVDFMEGLADDAEAVVNGCTESWNNGMVEGFVNKVKWIKRSSYGQAGFPLLQRRVLLHPSNLATGRKTKMCSA